MWTQHKHAQIVTEGYTCLWPVFMFIQVELILQALEYEMGKLLVMKLCMSFGQSPGIIQFFKILDYSHITSFLRLCS